MWSRHRGSSLLLGKCGEGARVDGGVEGWLAVDGPLPRCQLMTYSRVKLNVRVSQYQIHHLPISPVSTPLFPPIDCFFVNP